MQLVIAAITTRPWSSSTSLAVLELHHHRAGLALGDRRQASPPGEASACGLPASPSWASAGGSEAGNDSSIALSRLLPSAWAASGSNSASDSMNADFACREGDPVLRSLRAGERGLDLGEVELELLGEGRVLGVGVVEHPLLARVGVDELDRLGRAPGELEVAQRLAVDREDRAGRPELRRHVADRRAVGEPEGVQAGPEELDELRDHPMLAQHLGDREHEVGGGGALGQLAAELEPDDLGQQHRDRLAEHRRLGLDPADAPAEHAEAVDHRRVRIGADERVGIRLHRPAVPLASEHDLAQVLEIDLMADPGGRRDDAEVVERLLTPAQEGVALAVALVVAVGVDVEGAGVAERVHLHGVVDHQVDRDQRVDLRRDPSRARRSRRASPPGRRWPAPR